MLTLEQKTKVIEYIAQNDEGGNGCLLSRLGLYLRRELGVDWRAELTANKKLSNWLAQQDLPQAVYTNSMRASLSPFPQEIAPKAPSAAAPLYDPKSSRFSLLRKLIRSNLNRDGAIELAYLQALMSDPSNAFGRWQDNLSPNEASKKMPDWVSFHFGDEFTMQRQGTVWSLIHNKYLSRPKAAQYPLPNLDPTTEESLENVAQMRAFSQFLPSDLMAAMRRQSGYTGRDKGLWQAIAAHQVAYARRYPLEYCVEGLTGPNGKQRLLMRLPDVKTPRSLPLYFIFEENDTVTDAENAPATPLPRWRLLGCYRTGGHLAAAQWINQALRERSDYYLTDGVLTPENLPDAVTVWRALLRGGYLPQETWTQIALLCQATAGFPAQPETALFLHRFYMRNSKENPLYAALAETSWAYLKSLPDLNPALQRELRPHSKKVQSLFSILCALPPSGKLLSTYVICAGSFAFQQPGDDEIISRYTPFFVTDSCPVEEADALLRAIYARQTSGVSQAWKNLPIDDLPELQKALVSMQYITTPFSDISSPSCYHGVCTMAAFAVKYGLEAELLTAKTLLEYFSTASGSYAFVHFAALMLRFGHAEALYRWLHVLTLPPETTCLAFFQELKHAPMRDVPALVARPWVADFVTQLLPSGKRPSYPRMVKQFVWSAVHDQTGLAQMKLYAQVVKKLIECYPKDFSYSFLMFLICKQAAAICDLQQEPDSFDVFLPWLYLAEYGMCARRLTPLSKTSSNMLSRQEFSAQLCDLVLLACLMEAKGISFAGMPKPSNKLFVPLLQQAELLLQNPQNEQQALLDSVETLRQLDMDKLYTFYHSKLAYELPSKRKDTYRVIVARLTGSWEHVIADARRDPEWLKNQMDWLQDPIPNGEEHTVGLLRGLLQNYLRLPVSERKAFQTWVLQQIPNKRFSMKKLPKEQRLESPAVVFPYESLIRPLIQFYFLTTSFNQELDALEYVPRSYLLSNSDLLAYPLEEPFVPNRLVIAELYRLPQDSGNDAQPSTQWDERDYDRFSKRIRLMLFIRNDCHFALNTGTFFFSANRLHPGMRRNLAAAHAFYRAVTRVNRVITVSEAALGIDIAFFPLISERGLLGCDGSPSNEYACHILGSVGKAPKSKNLTEALVLSAFLHIFCYGRPEDIPLFLSRIPSASRTLLEALYPLLRIHSFQTLEEVRSFAREIGRTLHLPLSEFLTLALSKSLYPQFAEELVFAADHLLRSARLRDRGARFRDIHLYVPNSIYELLAERRALLPEVLYAAPTFVQHTERILEHLQSSGLLVAHDVTTEMPEMLHQLSILTEQANTPNPKRLLLLHRIYTHCAEETNTEAIPFASKQMALIELGMETLRWQRQLAGQTALVTTEHANDTFLKLAILLGGCTDESELSSSTCQAFSQQVVSGITDLFVSYTDLSGLLKMYSLNRSAFEYLMNELPAETGAEAHASSAEEFDYYALFEETETSPADATISVQSDHQTMQDFYALLETLLTAMQQSDQAARKEELNKCRTLAGYSLNAFPGESLWRQIFTHLTALIDTQSLAEFPQQAPATSSAASTEKNRAGSNGNDILDRYYKRLHPQP